MHWFRPLLLLAVAGFSQQLTRTELVPADPMLQEFVQRVRIEARTGSVVEVTDEMFSEMRRTMKEFPKVCTAPHRLAVDAYQVPVTEKDWEAVAVMGRGLCYCSMAGNCRMWIFRIKNGRLHRIFDTEEAEKFGFVRSHTGNPLLVVWTRESAVEKSAMVYKWDRGAYVEVASWTEFYEYEDEDEEFRVHATPKIYSDMPLGVFLPD